MGAGAGAEAGVAPFGESVITTECLNRGKHQSILALYGIEGFLAFDFKEGGYDADSFIAAVESTIVPHLNRYDVNDPLPNSIRSRQLPLPLDAHRGATPLDRGCCRCEARVPRSLLAHRQPHRAGLQLRQSCMAVPQLVA